MPTEVRAPGGSGRLVRWMRAGAETAVEPWVVLSIAHLSLLAFKLPLLAKLPGWFYPVQAKPLSPWWLVIGLALVPLLAWATLRKFKGRPAVALTLLLLLGYLFQQGLAWGEGRGIEGMRDRVRGSGHAEYVRIAAEQPTLWGVISEYERKLERKELGRFAHSKPPGQLLFYMLTERMGRLFATDDGISARMAAARTLASYLWPALSYLVLFPLFGVARRLATQRAAYIACLLYLLVPSVALITLHTDQVLFPLAIMTVVWLSLKSQASHRRAPAYAALAGVAAYLAAYCSYALLIAIPIAAACAVAAAMERRDDRALVDCLRAPARPALYALLGFAGMFTLVALGTGFDFLGSFAEAMTLHARWQHWRPEVGRVIQFGWVNLLAYFAWIGVPTAFLMLARCRRALLQLVGGEMHRLVLPGVMLIALLIYLAFFSHTHFETPRLWLLLVPPCCILAADELLRRYRTRPGRMVAFVLCLQWLTVVLTKMGQDFR